jgi:hypothetical protein
MKEMNSTFFMVISIVVIFLLLLLFFQTSCENKNNEINSDLFKNTNNDAKLYIQVDDRSTIDVIYKDTGRNINGLETNGWNKMFAFEFDSDFEQINVNATNGGGPGGLIAKVVIENDGTYLMGPEDGKYINVKRTDKANLIISTDEYNKIDKGWQRQTNSKLRASKWIQGENKKGTINYTLVLKGRPKKKEKKLKLNLPNIKSNINAELYELMEGGDIESEGEESKSELQKITSGESDAKLGIYRFGTDNIGVQNENQSLHLVGNFVNKNPITKGFDKKHKFIKWIGYIYCKEPKHYRFFLEANQCTLKISKVPLPMYKVKQLFKANKDNLDNNDKRQQVTTFEDESENARETLININSPREHPYIFYNMSPPNVVPKSNIKRLEHGIYRIEIVTTSKHPVNFYYTSEYLTHEISTYRSEEKCKIKEIWIPSWNPWWKQVKTCTDYKWHTFERFSNLRGKLIPISSNIEQPLTFFNFAETNKTRFPSGKEGIVSLNYNKSGFQNTNPSNIFNEQYSLQQLGKSQSIAFNNEFLIEFDINVKGTIAHYGNIFRITSTNNNCCNALDRVVAMWLYPKDTKDTKVHLVTSKHPYGGNNVYVSPGNFHVDNDKNTNNLQYSFNENTLTRVSIFTKYKDGDINNDRLLTFVAQKFDKEGNTIGSPHISKNLNIGRNPVANGKTLLLNISDKHHPPANASMSNFTFSTNSGDTRINYIRRMAELSYKKTGNNTVDKDTPIITDGIMPKNFVYQISIQNLDGNAGELFSINNRVANGKLDPILSDREPIMTLLRENVNTFRLIWNKYSEKSTIRFIIENTDILDAFKFLILVNDAKISIYQDLGTNNYVGLIRGQPIDNGNIFETESQNSNTNIYLCGPSYNGNTNKVNSFEFNPIPQFLAYNKDHPQFKYLDPAFKCENLTTEGQDKCGPSGTISARLNKECKWYNPGNAERLLEPLNLEEPNEFSKFKEITDEKYGKDTPICINSIHTKKCFMQDPTKGECRELPCIIHPHESGKPICLHMNDKPKVELTQPNQFNVEITPTFPISTIASIENPDNSKLNDLSQVINSQTDKLNELSKEIERLETIEGFTNFDNQGTEIDKVQSINQATTIYASPVENNETSFKLHVNGKCVTVYDKEKLLLTECQPNLVGHGFKKNKVNNNLVAKVETGVEPIMQDNNYPYPYEMIKSDLTSQCLNVDLKNNLTMQDCNPDKVDQFFRSHYTQKS